MDSNFNWEVEDSHDGTERVNVSVAFLFLLLICTF